MLTVLAGHCCYAWTTSGPGITSYQLAFVVWCFLYLFCFSYLFIFHWKYVLDNICMFCSTVWPTPVLGQARQPSSDIARAATAWSAGQAGPWGRVTVGSVTVVARGQRGNRLLVELELKLKHSDERRPARQICSWTCYPFRHSDPIYGWWHEQLALENFARPWKQLPFTLLSGKQIVGSDLKTEYRLWWHYLYSSSAALCHEPMDCSCNSTWCDM